MLSWWLQFLLHETNGDPVALLRSIADYIHRLTPVNQRFTCSRECLLRAAAETSFLQGKPQAQHCSRCKELQADQTHKTAEPFALIASEEFRSSFEISSAPSPRDGHSKQPTSTGETNEPISSTSHAPQSNSEDFTFQVGHVVRPVASGASSSSSEQSQTESHFQSRAPALVANQRVCFEDQVGVSDQECPTQKPVAGGSRSKPLVPSLHLKGPAASPRTGPAAVGTKTSKGNFRLIQSARGARPEASSRQLLDSPKGSKHGDLSERGRPHTSGMNGEPHAEPSGDGSESEGSSPRKDKGVKELMTPDEHIKVRWGPYIDLLKAGFLKRKLGDAIDLV